MPSPYYPFVSLTGRGHDTFLFWITCKKSQNLHFSPGVDLGGGCRGRAPPPPSRDDLRFSNTTGILQKKEKTMWFIGVEVEQETSAPPPKKNS